MSEEEIFLLIKKIMLNNKNIIVKSKKGFLIGNLLINTINKTPIRIRI